MRGIITVRDDQPRPVASGEIDELEPVPGRESLEPNFGEHLGDPVRRLPPRRVGNDRQGPMLGAIARDGRFTIEHDVSSVTLGAARGPTR
jgi:hypothetical protein